MAGEHDELALLAGGTAEEAWRWSWDQRMATEHPFFYDPHFQIPSREQEATTHEIKADRRDGDRRREYRSRSGRRRKRRPPPDV
jgi:hypothetical protein